MYAERTLLQELATVLVVSMILCMALQNPAGDFIAIFCWLGLTALLLTYVGIYAAVVFYRMALQVSFRVHLSRYVERAVK